MGGGPGTCAPCSLLAEQRVQTFQCSVGLSCQMLHACPSFVPASVIVSTYPHSVQVRELVLSVVQVALLSDL